MAASESATVPMPAHITPEVLYSVPAAETSRPFAKHESIVDDSTGEGFTRGHSSSQARVSAIACRRCPARIDS